MKLIGLLGGIGWETTATYYRMMNDYAARELGSRHSARILMHSIDSGAAGPDGGCPDRIDEMLDEAARTLKAGGADFLVTAANRMHQVADRIGRAAGLDLLHIADPTGSAISQNSHRKVALLGTSLAMEGNFFAHRLKNEHGIDTIVPEARERNEINRIIQDELSHGVVRPESRAYVGEIIGRLHARGADAVVLACSEIAMIVPPDSDIMPAYDAVRLHVRAAVRRSIGDAHD